MSHLFYVDVFRTLYDWESKKSQKKCSMVLECFVRIENPSMFIGTAIDRSFYEYLCDL